MKVLCIACSNVYHKKTDSASTKICELAADIIHEKNESIHVEIIKLTDYKLVNCIFCGQCQQNERCIYDENFNEIYNNMKESDGIVLAVPFYSVIPSKLTEIMEKINQLYYTTWLKNPNSSFALNGTKVAIIAHGGSNLSEYPEAVDLYRELLLKPLNYSLRSFGMDVIGLNEDSVKGVLFGVEGYTNSEGAIFPDMVHNWDAIKATISSFIYELIHN